MCPESHLCLLVKPKSRQVTLDRSHATVLMICVFDFFFPVWLVFSCFSSIFTKSLEKTYFQAFSLNLFQILLIPVLSLLSYENMLQWEALPTLLSFLCKVQSASSSTRLLYQENEQQIVFLSDRYTCITEIYVLSYNVHSSSMSSARNITRKCRMNNKSVRFSVGLFLQFFDLDQGK